MSRLVHVGQVIVDIVMYVPHLPERGGDVLASSGGTEVGGGFNVLTAAMRRSRIGDGFLFIGLLTMSVSRRYFNRAKPLCLY